VEQPAEAGTEQSADTTAAEETIAANAPEPGRVEAEAGAPDANRDGAEQNGSVPHSVQLAEAPHDDTSGESQTAREQLGSAAESEPATSSDSPPAEASDDHESDRASRPSPDPLPGVTT
jgi:hypothetical protein